MNTQRMHRHRGTTFTGKASVFDGEEAMLKGLEQGKIQKGDFIVVRYEGPKGGRGLSGSITAVRLHTLKTLEREELGP